MLNLSPEQVQSAMDYIREHDAQVHTEYQQIMSRIEQGHSEEAEARLQANFPAMLALCGYVICGQAYRWENQLDVGVMSSTVGK